MAFHMSDSKVLTRDPLPPGDRARLRIELRSAREAMPAERRQAAAETIAAHLDRLLLVVNGSPQLAVYWPTAGEPDLRPWMAARQAAGWTVLLPVVVTTQAPLAFRRWAPDVSMVPGAHGIPVPEGTEAGVPDILVIPALGFTPEGYRLGYGGGYYDRTLAALGASVLALGVAYEQAQLSAFAPGPHDVRLDAVVTDAAIHAGTDLQAKIDKRS
jgi:5-formyltetrahydrofolate cyclo-ligase